MKGSPWVAGRKNSHVTLAPNKKASLLGKILSPRALDGGLQFRDHKAREDELQSPVQQQASKVAMAGGLLAASKEDMATPNYCLSVAMLVFGVLMTIGCTLGIVVQMAQSANG